MTLYADKPTGYFAGARKAFIDDLPTNTQARLLEIGCGNGDTAAYAVSKGKCGWCAGVEICAEPAREASTHMNEVLVGDVEDIQLPFPREHFDVLIMSEVIEHLRDPWSTLKKLHAYLKPGGLVMAGSPNVAHYSVVFMLLNGRWDYTNLGIMDKSHYRWFTPSTYCNLFEDCGFEVISVGPAYPLSTKQNLANLMLLGRMQYLFYVQIYLRARRP
jgi:2-polyprenyl-3-methyl-5-hydroxy-6-metoxy-1,4-benzoquinol methylase